MIVAHFKSVGLDIVFNTALFVWVFLYCLWYMYLFWSDYSSDWKCFKYCRNFHHHLWQLLYIVNWMVFHVIKLIFPYFYHRDRARFDINFSVTINGYTGMDVEAGLVPVIFMMLKNCLPILWVLFFFILKCNICLNSILCT